MIIKEKTLQNRKSTYIVMKADESFEIATNFLDFESNNKTYRTIIRTNATIIDKLPFYLENKYNRENSKTAFLRDVMKFYQFLDCLQINEQEFLEDNNNYIKLAYFLAKKDINFTNFTLEFENTIKSSASNKALSNIKQYLEECLCLSCVDFITYSPKTIIPNTTSTTEIQKHLGKKCLSLDELSLILSAAKHKNLTTYALMLVLFNTGCRIGTVLGLTEEDLKLKYQDGQISYHLIVRNRLSNKPYQMVKNLPVPIDYKTEPPYYDYHISPLCYETLNELIKYNKRNSRTSDYKKNAYHTEAVADVICKYSALPNKENHYLFLSKRCERLHVVNWNNNYLIPLFKECGIDYSQFTQCKNHIFRHSIVKHLQNKANLSIEGVKHLLRDKSYDAAKTYMGNIPEDIKIIDQKHSQFLGELLLQSNYGTLEYIDEDDIETGKDEQLDLEGGYIEYAETF